MKMIYLFDEFPCDGVVPIVVCERLHTAVLLCEDFDIFRFVIYRLKIYSRKEFLYKFA